MCALLANKSQKTWERHKTCITKKKQDKIIKATHLSPLLPPSPTHHTHDPNTRRYTAVIAMLPAYPPSHSYRSSVAALARRDMSPERSWWHCSDMKLPALAYLEEGSVSFSSEKFKKNPKTGISKWLKIQTNILAYQQYLQTLLHFLWQFFLTVVQYLSGFAYVHEQDNHHGTTIDIDIRPQSVDF